MQVGPGGEVDHQTTTLFLALSRTFHFYLGPLGALVARHVHLISEQCKVMEDRKFRIHVQSIYCAAEAFAAWWGCVGSTE